MANNWNKYRARLRERDLPKYQAMRREQNRKYIERKLDAQLKENKEAILTATDDKIKNFIRKLTRIQFNDVLPKQCYCCGNDQDLQIHHYKYTYPIDQSDLKRLCRRCHVLAHQIVPISGDEAKSIGVVEQV